MRPQRFRDRSDAGRRLAEKLAAYADRQEFWSWHCRAAGYPSLLKWPWPSARRSIFSSYASSVFPDTRSWRWVRSRPAASAF